MTMHRSLLYGVATVSAFATALLGGLASADTPSDNGLPPALEAVQFEPSVWFDEESCTMEIEPNVRIHVNRPREADPGIPTRVLIYALPNGNTIEQTLGCKTSVGLDWHYDIQHVAAQVRFLRAANPQERLVLICAEAHGLSWPSWRKNRKGANEKILELVNAWRIRFGNKDARVCLTAHSGGGSFLWGVIEASSEIPDSIDRIVFLDANYSFDATMHTEKLRQWLVNDQQRQLVVIAYDDRRIEYDGKLVVGPDGGTFRATNRMRLALQSHFPISSTARPPFTEYRGCDHRIWFDVHENSDNKILHTALVGEMNGLIHALTLQTKVSSNSGPFGGPRVYEDWIEPASTNSLPALPALPEKADSGTSILKHIESMGIEQREEYVLQKVLEGNFPAFLREFKRIPISGITADRQPMSAELEVSPDYLAVGTNSDFVRMPLRPLTAQKIADRLGCVLPTRKMVDAIDRRAKVRLAPQPLTEQRESLATFVQHHQMIQSQLTDQPQGGLLTGIKKDIVLSPRLFERPHRLAIYGWRKLDGEPIQPLTIVHVDQYVDYSHGVRLVRDSVAVDGQSIRITALLGDARFCGLVSDEGVIDPPRYP